MKHSGHFAKWAVPLLFLGIALLFITTCSGGGSGGDSGPAPASAGGGWIRVTSPDGTSPHDNICSTAALTGEAFISKEMYHCCSGTADDTGVIVTWQNLSTGAGGNAYQSVEIRTLFGSPYLYLHTWSATVPLAVGSNTVRIRAEEVAPGTAWAETEAVFILPELAYEVQGRVTTTDGRPLSWLESGIELSLAGRGSTVKALAGSDGSYRFSCVRNGSYGLSPSGPFGQAFEPASYSVTMEGADVAGFDFAAAVYFLSGSVRWENGGAPAPGDYVSLESGDRSMYAIVDSQGNYRRAVPDGNYVVRVCNPVLPYPPDTFTPETRSVTVSGADVSGVDFLKH